MDMRSNRVLCGLTLAIALQTSWAQIPTNVVVKPFIQSPQGGNIVKPVYFNEFPNLRAHFIVLEHHTGAVCVLRTVNGDWVKEQFLKVTVQTSNEMGLLGFAFHPRFAQNRKYYVVYNPSGSTPATLLEEREADATFLKDSGNPPRLILRIAKSHTNHNGGGIAFDKDGFLNFGIGDGFEGNPTAEKTRYLPGTMVRIDVDNPANDKPYGIPADNPYATSTDPAVRKELWATGLRNPWRWSFDALNGDLWAGDVGDNIEEVDLIRKGEDMGWPTMQGKSCLSGSSCNSAGFTPPIIDLNRGDATSVIGGYVFRGNERSPFYGAYIFGDHYSRMIWALTHDNRVLKERVQIALSPSDISSFGTDAAGNIYVVGYNNGRIYILDHPELNPSAVRSKPGKPPRQGSIRRSLSGGYLDPAGLAGAEAVEIYSPAGVKSWNWHRNAGVAPTGPLRNGINLVRVRFPGGSDGRILVQLP